MSDKYPRKIKFINNRSFNHNDIEAYFKKTLSILDKYGIVLDTSEQIERFLANPFEFTDTHALVVVDDWYYKNKRDWSSVVNKILTSPLRDNNNFSVVICTRNILTKTLMRRPEVDLIEKLV